MQRQVSCLNDDDGRRRVHVVGSGKMLNENEQRPSFLRREAALAYPQGIFPSLVVLGLTADLDPTFLAEWLWPLHVRLDPVLGVDRDDAKRLNETGYY